MDDHAERKKEVIQARNDLQKNILSMKAMNETSFIPLYLDADYLVISKGLPSKVTCPIYAAFLAYLDKQNLNPKLKAYQGDYYISISW